MSTLRERRASSVTLPISARDNPERLLVPITSKSGRVCKTALLMTSMGEPSTARRDQRVLPQSLDTRNSVNSASALSFSLLTYSSIVVG